jgi:hypothetical protein
MMVFQQKSGASHNSPTKDYWWWWWWWWWCYLCRITKQTDVFYIHADPAWFLEGKSPAFVNVMKFVFQQVKLIFCFSSERACTSIGRDREQCPLLYVIFNWIPGCSVFLAQCSTMPSVFSLSTASSNNGKTGCVAYHFEGNSRYNEIKRDLNVFYFTLRKKF